MYKQNKGSIRLTNRRSPSNFKLELSLVLEFLALLLIYQIQISYELNSISSVRDLKSSYLAVLMQKNLADYKES